MGSQTQGREALFVGSQTAAKTNLKNAVFYILRQSVVYSKSTALGVRFVIIPIALAYNALYFQQDYFREKFLQVGYFR